MQAIADARGYSLASWGYPRCIALGVANLLYVAWNNSCVLRYDFAIVGSNPFNLILGLSRQSDTPKFSIACATKLSMGQREGGKDDCLQSPLPLPK